jgi:hypothetical protein
MAQKPDGKPARTERVTFTKPAAERIAKVVRAVEGGDRDAGPLTFGNRGVVSNPKAFRICTFTGSWSINATKVVTFKYQTATPNTVTVQNVLFPIPQLSSNPSSPTVCAIGKDGQNWYLLNVAHEQHDALTGVSLTPDDLQFSRRLVLSISTTASTAGISVSSCETGQASSVALSYFQ